MKTTLVSGNWNFCPENKELQSWHAVFALAGIKKFFIETLRSSIVIHVETPDVNKLALVQMFFEMETNGFVEVHGHKPDTLKEFRRMEFEVTAARYAILSIALRNEKAE